MAPAAVARKNFQLPVCLLRNDRQNHQSPPISQRPVLSGDCLLFAWRRWHAVAKSTRCRIHGAQVKPGRDTLPGSATARRDTPQQSICICCRSDSPHSLVSLDNGSDHRAGTIILQAEKSARKPGFACITLLSVVVAVHFR